MTYRKQPLGESSAELPVLHPSATFTSDRFRVVQLAKVRNAADARLKIPMRDGLRSLNVAIAAAMAAGEALRQTGGMKA